MKKDLEPALLHREHYRIGELRQKGDTILKEVPMYRYCSYFEKSSAVMNSKTHNINQIFWFEPMHIFDLGISTELKMCLADWGVKIKC